MPGRMHKRMAAFRVLKNKAPDLQPAPVAVVLLAVAGCVNPSEKIASSLTTYGLNASQSQCVGDRLERNLSTGELQELGRAARAYSEGDTTPGHLTGSDLVRVAARFENPKVPIEVGKAAAECGVLTGVPRS